MKRDSNLKNNEEFELSNFRDIGLNSKEEILDSETMPGINVSNNFFDTKKGRTNFTKEEFLQSNSKKAAKKDVAQPLLEAQKTCFEDNSNKGVRLNLFNINR